MQRRHMRDRGNICAAADLQCKSANLLEELSCASSPETSIRSSAVLRAQSQLIQADSFVLAWLFTIPTCRTISSTRASRGAFSAPSAVSKKAKIHKKSFIIARASTAAGPEQKKTPAIDEFVKDREKKGRTAAQPPWTAVM